MEEVGLRDVAHYRGTMSKHVESSVDMPRQDFGFGCLLDAIAERSTYIVIPPVVLLVPRDIIFKFVL